MTKNVTFCITGKLDGIERKDAISLIENKTNAKWVSGVSSKTHYLISPNLVFSTFSDIHFFKKADLVKPDPSKKIATSNNPSLSLALGVIDTL